MVIISYYIVLGARVIRPRSASPTSPRLVFGHESPCPPLPRRSARAPSILRGAKGVPRKGLNVG